MIAAAALMPAAPFGANPPVVGLVQLVGLIRKMPTAMKNKMIPTLSSTIALFVSADSLIPMTRMIVISATTATAGRFMMIGRPRTCGAVLHAAARYCVVASVAPV